MKYCAGNNVILQLVVAYNHMMQACVEGAIGCVKQHSWTSLLHANKPTHFWDDTTKGLSIKKVCLWASPDTRNKLETAHDHMQPAFLALTKPLLYLSEVKSLLNSLVSTAWSRTDHLEIVLLKAHTSIVTQLHLASGCSASPSNARWECKISSSILSSSLSKTHQVSRATNSNRKSTCTSFCRDWPAKALHTKPLGNSRLPCNRCLTTQSRSCQTPSAPGWSSAGSLRATMTTTTPAGRLCQTASTQPSSWPRTRSDSPRGCQATRQARNAPKAQSAPVRRHGWWRWAEVVNVVFCT